MKALATLAAAAFLMFGMSAEAHAQAYPSTDAPAAIPDGGPGCGPEGTALTSSITVADGGTVSDLDVRLDITHTWVGDLIVRLDDGTTTVDLVNQPGDLDNGTGCGSSEDNIVAIGDDEGGSGSFEDSAPYAAGGRYTTNDALSAFDGANLAATWTLTVIDTGGGDLGTLNGWELLFNGASPTAIEGGSEGIPGSYALSDVYPNPFRSEASFTLEVAETQRVTVGVYNLLGQRVSTLYDGTLAAGQAQQLRVQSAGLASGLYLVRVDGEAFSDTRRVTLLN